MSSVRSGSRARRFSGLWHPARASPPREPLRRGQVEASRGCAEPFRASTKGSPGFRVRATRGFRADAIASRPEGLTVAGRRRVKPSGEDAVRVVSCSAYPPSRRRAAEGRRERGAKPPSRRHSWTRRRLALRANTKRHGREIARRAIEGAQAPLGLDACGIARRRPRALPLRAFAAAPARTRTCGATRKRVSLSSRHESASPPPRNFVAEATGQRFVAGRTGRSRESARPRSGSPRARSRRANHCDVAKSRLREKPRSLFVPRREACRVFVSAPRAVFVPTRSRPGPKG